jgi:hypothetical protein
MIQALVTRCTQLPVALRLLQTLSTCRSLIKHGRPYNMSHTTGVTHFSTHSIVLASVVSLVQIWEAGSSVDLELIGGLHAVRVHRVTSSGRRMACSAVLAVSNTQIVKTIVASS